MISKSTAIWDREYSEAQVIPSSTRTKPSQALLLFSELLGFRSMKKALDAGCGNGRNSLYLAGLGLKIEALDSSPIAIAETHRRVQNARMLDRISIWERDLAQPLPFNSNSFNLCLDFYVYCHFLDEQLRRHYVEELWRVTKPGGYTISTLFSPQDEYYQRLAAGSKIVKDPANDIFKVLYTKDEFRKEFSPPFAVQYLVEFEFDDVVQGNSFHRNILAMALHKPM